MERFTKYDESGAPVFMWKRPDGFVVGMANKAISQLAVYEDLAHTPAELTDKLEKLARYEQLQKPIGYCPHCGDAYELDIIDDKPCIMCDGHGVLINLEDAAAIAQAKTDGRVVVLPCKVGETVYRIVNDAMPHIVKDMVLQASFNHHGRWIVLVADRLINIDDFGKTVFLTPAEAEDALQKV